MKKLSAVMIVSGLIGILSLGMCGSRLYGSEKLGRPCKKDVEKFCKDIKPGEGRVHDCLRKHHKVLSAECKGKMKKAKEKRKKG